MQLTTLLNVSLYEVDVHAAHFGEHHSYVDERELDWGVSTPFVSMVRRAPLSLSVET
jgi:hypothetical protein